MVSSSANDWSHHQRKSISGKCANLAKYLARLCMYIGIHTEEIAWRLLRSLRCLWLWLATPLHQLSFRNTTLNAGACRRWMKCPPALSLLSLVSLDFASWYSARRYQVESHWKVNHPFRYPWEFYSDGKRTFVNDFFFYYNWVFIITLNETDWHFQVIYYFITFESKTILKRDWEC